MAIHSPERELWLAVLAQAMRDALRPESPLTEEQWVARGNNGRAAIERERRKAHEWFTRPSHRADFARVCEMCDLDPARVRAKYREQYDRINHGESLPIPEV